MGYYIDLKSISIDNYKNKLLNGFLLPSRQILREKAEEKFNYFKIINIRNVAELQQTLKKKNKLLEIAGNSLFSEDYLVILLREINSIQPKPNNISDFVGISDDVKFRLSNVGIRNTLQLFDQVINYEKRLELIEKTGIREETILELTRLTDLSRIKWVGTMFARVLYETGYDSAEKVSKADYEEMYKRIATFNKEQHLYKGQIGLNDMKMCVAAAQEVPLDIEY